MDLPVVIPCYFHTEESFAAMAMSEDLNIDVDIDDDYDVKDVYFFSITYVVKHPFLDQTMIGANGEDFRSPLTIDEVLAILK